MDGVGLQLAGASAYPLTGLPIERSAGDGTGLRGVQGGNLNPIDRVQSVSFEADTGDYGAENAVDSGYAYGPFYTNRLIYLDIQAELMVVQFRDALDREVRLQFPPELTLKAYRGSGRPEREELLPAPATGDEAVVPVIGKPANDGLPEALSVEPGWKPAPADTPAGVAPLSDREKSPSTPGQTIELVA
jgi:hypothetical protein